MSWAIGVQDVMECRVFKINNAFGSAAFSMSRREKDFGLDI